MPRAWAGSGLRAVARHGSRFITAFEDQLAWLLRRSALSTVAQLLRLSWRSVSPVVGRVVVAVEAIGDPLAHLERIGIDEISYRKGRATCWWLPTTTQGVWSGLTRAGTEPPWSGFSTPWARSGARSCAGSAATAPAGSPTWSKRSAHRRSRALIPTTSSTWATDSLDQVRRAVWNQARRSGDAELAHALKRARWARWHNPEDLTGNQQLTLAEVARANQPLYRVYLLKEELRLLFPVGHQWALTLLQHWIKRARRCRLAPLVKLARTITNYFHSIAAAIRYRLSNALVWTVHGMCRQLGLIVGASF